MTFFKRNWDWLVMLAALLCAVAVAKAGCPPLPVYTPDALDVWGRTGGYVKHDAEIVADFNGVVCGNCYRSGDLWLLHIYGGEYGAEFGYPQDGDKVSLRCDALLGCAKLKSFPAIRWESDGPNNMEVHIIWPGDFDRDGDIDAVDVVRLGGVAFQGKVDPTVYDLDGDCLIGATDVVKLAHVAYWGYPIQGLWYGEGCR